MNYKQSILGSSIAFILATSCCWLPWLIIAIGGATGLAGLNAGLEKFSGIFMLVGIGFLGFGFFQFYKKKIQNMKKTAVLESTITCPKCNHAHQCVSIFL
jgi:4-amino-4-deoxy-L-arabinose transferase-like glycosyltransferase